MISALNVASGNLIDSEYLWIIQELRRFGLSPTGNKNLDLGRLEQAKTQLIEKIQHKASEDDQQSIKVQTMQPVDEAETARRAEMELQKLGAVKLAELNKISLGLI